SSHISIRLLYWGVGGMSYQHSRLSFDTIDRPTCPYCGERAYLTRRTPHSDHDLRYELQIFTCSACDHMSYSQTLTAGYVQTPRYPSHTGSPPVQYHSGP